MLKSKTLNKLRIALMKRSPGLYVPLARLAARFMFSRERGYLAGSRESSSDATSIFHFCYNRCASRFISQLIVKLGGEERLTHIDLPRFYVHNNREGIKALEEDEFCRDLFKTKGFYYGPFYRTFAGLPDTSDYRVVLTLRDPRDVLTSRYFSQAFAHTLFDKGNIKRREQVQQMTVDEFVLEQEPELKKVYLDYHGQLMSRPEVLFLPYEEMVADFSGWLRRLIEHLRLEPEEELVERIIEESDFGVKKEDKYSHRRSVKPGNHLEKLQPDTISSLNERLGEVLEKFQYPADASKGAE